ncbi:MAG TPA: hypothetical protein DCS93_07375 [Microscillaceae bacterium]|nr:hypothetical protein [Microscillaceae bacterium]
MTENLNAFITEQLKSEVFQVLVVDDDELNQMIISELLKKWDICAEFAISGEQALEVVNQYPDKFDIILMDVYLPQMSGLEATRELRTKFDISVPIIALTADSMRDTKDSILNAGMNDVMIKPLKPEGFHKMLGHYLQMRLEEKNA